MFRGILLTGVIGGSNAGELLSEKFASWILRFEKHYESEGDRALAFQNFVQNDEMYASHNAKKLSWTLGHNEFSDLTWEQFSRSRLGLSGVFEKTNVDYSLLNATNLATSVDWVEKGAVTPVKNQGSCGSCWTFSTTGAMEGAYYLKYGNLLSFSEQQIVSCSKYGGNGCNGGLPTRAITWLETNALCLEDDYPYKSGGSFSHNQPCHTCAGYVKADGVYNVPTSESALMAALQKGPVSIAIEADKSAFQGYSGGVLDNTACGQQLDHAVLLVGAGTDATTGKDYWKIKNSWGSGWGEKGYIRFVRGKNQCGLDGMACYPTGVEKITPAPTPPPVKKCWLSIQCPHGQKCKKDSPFHEGICTADSEEVVV
jgi:C1A family cysteine protease